MGFQAFEIRGVLGIGKDVAVADGTNVLFLFGGNQPAQILLALFGTNNDSIIHHLNLGKVVGGNFASLGSVVLPIGAGYGGLVGVDILGTLFPATSQPVLLSASDDFYIQVEEAVLTDFTVHVNGWTGLF